MIIDSLREYFKECPLISQGAMINIDYLGVDAVEYTIDSVPTDKLLKQFVDGGKIEQYNFVFGSREYYGADVLQNIANSGFYEELEAWVEEQSEAGNLPDLGNGRDALSLEVLTSGYLFDASEDNARYQIQLNLVYYED